MPDEPLIEVELLEVPVPLRDRALQHSDELLREMTLVAMQIREGDGQELPLRLTQLAADVQVTYGAFTATPESLLDSAHERGEDVVARVVYTVPLTVGPFARHLIEVLEETEEFCRAGTYLLALASPPDVMAYRMWTLLEFERQTAGEAATSWPKYAAEHGLPA
ncbi:hypothetical protein acdb102_12750 [Acidothermaceae bacterium B102]|nr:hypothetical protein acdb102_12750 [Acidothermaceae bacterium B102]